MCVSERKRKREQNNCPLKRHSLLTKRAWIIHMKTNTLVCNKQKREVFLQRSMYYFKQINFDRSDSIDDHLKREIPSKRDNIF